MISANTMPPLYSGPACFRVPFRFQPPKSPSLIISFSAAVKEPEKYELYSLWSLNEDGEDREEQWLWRGEPELEESRHGPVKEMMDDSSKTALFIELVKYDFMDLKPFIRASSMDE